MILTLLKVLEISRFLNYFSKLYYNFSKHLLLIQYNLVQLLKIINYL